MPTLHTPGEHSHDAHRAVVETEGLTVMRSGRPVLEDVSICIDQGTFTGILGPNGGGKTTFLKVLLGLLPYERGTVRVLGRAPEDLGPVRADIGYVPQHTQVEDSFPATVLDVVLMGAYRAIGFARPVRRVWKDRAREALARMGVDDLAARPFTRLSGGQRQRALVARALVAGPELLLFDEPTTGVDVKGRTQLMELLLALRKELDLTILMVTHDITLIREYAGQVACLNRRLHWHEHSGDLTAEMIEEAFRTDYDLLVAERAR